MRISIFIVSALALFSCSQNSQEIRNYGRAQGTTYAITYLSESNRDYHSGIDSILIAVDKSMSTWVESSIISRINRGDSGVVLDPLFIDVLSRSLQISELTQGSFDITVAPLVNAYGFGPKGKIQIDSSTVDSLMSLVGYQKILLNGNMLKKAPHQQIDFNAIAQGYSVDLIGNFLESKGVHDYMAEVGGELRTKGKNTNGKPWRIGIDKPQEDIDTVYRFQIILNLSGRALATSGNYRKFSIDEATGMKYVHTINPTNGYPVKSNLLSASIISNSCMDADAFATACMVKGLRGARSLILQIDDIEGFLVYVDDEGHIQQWLSPGFEQYID